ncbi:TadE family protein [Gemmobacter sp. 24YEA27]|uniref:TadE family protein n=1 Tax=Gemmobacter sp. 24YEA27 TaxID=3040672 RepID=UPI0024B39A79|nr:TadE family protein [Gemmobacter sp. 24YEA27]
MTAEFVIIFPLVLALIFLIVFISMYISAASDLQQVVHELARYSYRFAGRPEASQLCATLERDAVPVLVNASLLLHPENFTLISCSPPQGPDRIIVITASYDFAGSFVQSAGRTLGLSIGTITRQSLFIP